MTPEHNTPTLNALRAARGAGRRRVKRTSPTNTAVGYLRVSGEEQKATGLGIEAQRSAIHAECIRRDMEVTFFTDEGVSGRVPPDKRRGLAASIACLDRGEASLLVVAKVDRLARSLADLALLSELGEKAGWNIVALNAPFDTTTPQGRMMRQVLGMFAELEAAMGSDRMRAVAAVRRARGEVLGRPSQIPAEARLRVRELRDGGASWSTVADLMNQEGWSTSQGGVWHPTTAQRAYKLGAVK